MALPNINTNRTKKKTANVDISSMMYGKIPPQVRELEEAVLGAILLEKSAFDTVTEILKPECFYVESHQMIYRSMQSLQQKNMPIDMLTVVEELRMQENLDIVGGAYYISKLTNVVVSTANIDAHARIVLQKFIQRELIRISGEVIANAYEDSTDVFDLLDDSETKMFNITNNYLKKNFVDIGFALAAAITRIDELRTKKDEISGVPSGFASLDRITYGWQPTDLIILAARPSVGKTAFALNLARNAALHPTKPQPVGFFSLEMSASQLVQRILSAESEIKMEKISRGKLEDYEYQQLHTKGINRLESAPIYIDDQPGNNILKMRAIARRLKSEKGLGLIIVDYLQLMVPTTSRHSDNVVQQVTEISRSLKNLARELDVPVIALSQLSRAVEQRGGKPRLSDLRDSGSIEQDADVVMFIHREDKYNENSDKKGIAEIMIEKHRNGPTGVAELFFDEKKTTFMSIERNDFGDFDKS